MCEDMARLLERLLEKVPVSWQQDPSPLRNGLEAHKDPANAGAAGGSRSKSPFPEPHALAMSRDADTASDSDISIGDAETLRGRRLEHRHARLALHDLQLFLQVM